MQLIAHRGLSRRFPENSMPALQAAVDSYAAGQADRVEFDLCLTRDGQFVVIHDDTLNRTTSGQGFVAHHSVAELKQLDAGSWFKSTAATGQAVCHVPTVDEVLQALGGRIPMNIEVKPFVPIDYAQLWQSAIWRLLKQLNQQTWLADTIVSSSNMFMLEYIRQMHDEIKLGMIYQPPVTDYDPLYVAERLQAYSVHPHFRVVNEAWVDNMRAAGLQVYAYTINSEKRLRKLQQAGVDGVFTDVPDKLHGWLAEV